jgi:hypothetical protein
VPIYAANSTARLPAQRTPSNASPPNHRTTDDSAAFHQPPGGVRLTLLSDLSTQEGCLSQQGGPLLCSPLTDPIHGGIAIQAINQPVEIDRCNCFTMRKAARRISMAAFSNRQGWLVAFRSPRPRTHGHWRRHSRIVILTPRVELSRLRLRNTAADPSRRSGPIPRP